MQARWLAVLENSIPQIDLEDVHVLLEDPQQGRQFASEFSQSSYLHMLSQDYAIGNYLRKGSKRPGAFSEHEREKLILIC